MSQTKAVGFLGTGFRTPRCFCDTISKLNKLLPKASADPARKGPDSVSRGEVGDFSTLNLPYSWHNKPGPSLLVP